MATYEPQIALTSGALVGTAQTLGMPYIPQSTATIDPGGDTITATTGTPAVTAPDTVNPTGTTIAATGGTPTLTMPGEIDPSGDTITATGGTPAVTAPDTVSPDGVTVTATGGTPFLLGNGLLPWMLPVTLGGPNILTPSGATISTTSGTSKVADVIPVSPGGTTISSTPGTPTVAQIVPAQSPLPWTLPIVLGGDWDIFPGPARIVSTGGTPVASGVGFPYTFPFTFPVDIVAVSPETETITTAPGAPLITGGTPAVTPIGTKIYAEPGTPLISGPTQRAITPGGDTIATKPGSPSVQTVQSTVTVFLVDGSPSFIDWPSGALSPVGSNPILSTVAGLVNTQTATVKSISWPDAFPLQNALNVGANNLAVEIGNCGGQFILVGYSEGAAICSMALQQMQSGGLTGYAPNCVGAVMIGNPCRQGGAIAPVQTDPGGHGIWSANLLTQTPTWWWEFALPNDIATVIPNSLFGQDVASIFGVMLANYTGGKNYVPFILDHLGSGVQINAQAIGQLVLLLATLSGTLPATSSTLGFTAHSLYHSTVPPGAGQTCAQLAAAYINEITSPGTIRTTRTIAPGGTTITAAVGFPDVANIVSPGGDTVTTAPGTATVTAPETLFPNGDKITTIMGQPNRVPGQLPWLLPELL